MVNALASPLFMRSEGGIAGREDNVIYVDQKKDTIILIVIDTCVGICWCQSESSESCVESQIPSISGLSQAV